MRPLRLICERETVQQKNPESQCLGLGVRLVRSCASRLRTTSGPATQAGKGKPEVIPEVRLMNCIMASGLTRTQAARRCALRRSRQLGYFSAAGFLQLRGCGIVERLGQRPGTSSAARPGT